MHTPTSTTARAIHFQLDNEKFVARGAGPMSEIVARSASRRIEGQGFQMWPGNEPGHYRATWFDDVREIFCEAPVVIFSELARA